VNLPGADAPRHKRFGLWLLLLVLVHLLGGGAFLHAQVLGTISTVAGQCATTGYVTEPSQATANKLGNTLQGVATDSAGNLYIADTQNSRIRRVDTTGIITTIAGTGAAGTSPDGTTATSALVNQPQGIAVDPSTGNIYIADTKNNLVRVISGGTIKTVIGGGTSNTDGVSGTAWKLTSPTVVAFDSANGNLYVDDANNSLRVWNIAANKVTTVATGLGGPIGVAVYAGVPYIAESGGSRAVSKYQSGTKTVIAGAGSATIPAYPATIAASTSKFNHVWPENAICMKLKEDAGKAT
jgi:DNA-binding beta-propeller fold protein YncE